MSVPTEPQRELSSTYIVQDRAHPEEIARLALQDTMLTTGMGGVLPEQADPTVLRRVLDVGCGTGGWLLETAKTYPAIETLVGADISNTIVAHARAQAKAHHLDGRVAFQTMDALRMLEFPTGFFDLVNQRLGTSWVRTWDWAKLLSEYQRVTRSGGIIRITETAIVESTSPALTTLCAIVLETCYRSGRFFTKTPDGAIGRLVPLMLQHGIEDIHTRDYIFLYKAGTEEHRQFAQDMTYLFRVAVPFFQRWTRLPENYEQLYQQALIEMQQPDFVATWHVLTAWGTRPKRITSFLVGGLP